jgi:hypothetical protein
VHAWCRHKLINILANKTYNITNRRDWKKQTPLKSKTFLCAVTASRSGEEEQSVSSCITWSVEAGVQGSLPLCRTFNRASWSINQSKLSRGRFSFCLFGDWKMSKCTLQSVSIAVKRFSFSVMHSQSNEPPILLNPMQLEGSLCFFCFFAFQCMQTPAHAERACSFQSNGYPILLEPIRLHGSLRASRDDILPGYALCANPIAG